MMKAGDNGEQPPAVVAGEGQLGNPGWNGYRPGEYRAGRKKGDRKVNRNRTPDRAGSLRSHIVLLTALSPVVFLASCVTVGSSFDSAPVRRICIGQSTMADVRAMLGNPRVVIDVATWDCKRMHFGDENAKTFWRYYYARATIGGARVRFLQVDFDEREGVTDYYFSSSFQNDKTTEPEERDFDILLAKEQIVPGKTAQAEVLKLLGDNYAVVNVNKPGTSERWYYLFTRQSGEKQTGSGVEKTYVKSLRIDFDKNGTVAHIRGASDFPADMARSVNEGQ